MTVDKERDAKLSLHAIYGNTKAQDWIDEGKSLGFDIPNEKNLVELVVENSVEHDGDAEQPGCCMCQYLC